MPRNQHPDKQTIFILVPDNTKTQDFIRHPANSRFVSAWPGSALGLEVGYHVSDSASSKVIGTLGRTGDLHLPGDKISRIHASFEVNSRTGALKLVSRASVKESVKKSYLNRHRTVVRVYGGGVIPYGEGVRVSFGDYKFRVLWRPKASTRACCEQFVLAERNRIRQRQHGRRRVIIARR